MAPTIVFTNSTNRDIADPRADTWEDVEQIVSTEQAKWREAAVDKGRDRELTVEHAPTRDGAAGGRANRKNVKIRTVFLFHEHTAPGNPRRQHARGLHDGFVTGFGFVTVR